MAEEEEQQLTTLSQRIAALNLKQVHHNGLVVKAKRPPPPPPPPAAHRPPLPVRWQTTNNPPVATYGSSVTKQENNQPIGIENITPAPPSDRDQHGCSSRSSSRAPPPLPARKATAPALFSRNKCTDMDLRRGSSDSATSSSTTSSTSLSNASSISSTLSIEGRRLPPPFEKANLPSLPPTKREREAVKEAARVPRVPLMAARSAPLLSREFPADPATPTPPPTVNGTPRLPARPSRNNLHETTAASSPVPVRILPARPSRYDLHAEADPAVPVRSKAPSLPVRPSRSTEEAGPRRRLPPPAAHLALPLDFDVKPEETQNSEPSPSSPMVNRPVRTAERRCTSSRARSRRLAVVELTADNFDSIIMAGKPSIIDFYIPQCKYCVELEPHWQRLDQEFTSNRFIVAKCDVKEHISMIQRFNIEMFPTILSFDGTTEESEMYHFARDYSILAEYLGNRGIGSTGSPSLNAPPPINMSSKPSNLQVEAVKARPVLSPTSHCLICREYSGPDTVATKYPRETLLGMPDITGHLANVLCAPFSSPTDKARAIFTWLHHNIAYDTGAFFSRNVKHVDPKDTIASGLAVCGGYAGVFVAIALKAGLEAVMVRGHGKGYGFSALQPGEPIPPCDPGGHAWNAVRIDNGEWKLLDACWGAGNVVNQTYIKKFTPSYFTMSNEDFGSGHFPADECYFHRNDGRIPTWRDYIIGPAGEDPLQLYGAVVDHGLSGPSFLPAQKRVSIHGGGMVRFQFSKICEHWDFETNGAGKPYCMVLKIYGVDGQKEDYVAMQTDRYWWWADVEARQLGKEGDKISCYAVTSFNGKDGRGLGREEYLKMKGRVGMGFGGVAAWILV